MREFVEELGQPVPAAAERLLSLGEVRQPSGKRLRVWAGEGDLDPASIVPGTFTLEWPPRSGRSADFPEVDRVAWWSLAEARRRVTRGQRPFLDRLAAALEIDAD
jgi:predicted NUDIX family NTP pyrophosphohydrolase